MKTMTIQFKVGLMAPSLRFQIREMGLKYDRSKIHHLEKLLQSVFYLELNDIITEKIATAAIKKITTKALAHVRKVNKLKLVRNEKSKI